MNPIHSLDSVKVRSIFHPSDFSAASEVAFMHALKIALVTGSELNMLHVAGDATVKWQDFPGVRATLERWSLLPPGSPASAIHKLGIDVDKVITRRRNPVEACLEFLQQRPADLIVLAVKPQDGRMHWLEKSVGTPIVRGAKEITLLIPHGVEGFVSRQDGSVHLQQILIPVAAKPRPQPALEAAARLIRSLQLPPGTVTLLHAGSESDMPALQTPKDTGWRWERVAKAGDPADLILQSAADLGAELILMTSDGPDGFLDALRGSTSERVLRQARCPVGNLPAGSMLG